VSNSNATASASSSGIGVFGLAFAVLLIFKLAGMAGASWGLANLSWWWVFSPLLIGFGLSIVVLIVFFVSVLAASK